MLLRIPRGWELNERDASPESLYVSRRGVMRGLAGAALTAAAGRLLAQPQNVAALRNSRFQLDRPLTEAAVAARSVIFDEMGARRADIQDRARKLIMTPWAIHIGGAVKQAKTIDVADLIRQLGVEERLYRHRCVEAWAMAVPWIGIPLKKFVTFADPTSSARYLRMVSVSIPSQLPGWYETKRVFPYYEALTLAEATNELALLATGIYGKQLPAHHGGPIRLVVPWKYGFKSIKSIVGFEFTAEKPSTFWNDLAPAQYAWSSNVDPTETKPWPQNSETMIGSSERRDTLPFNGYAEFVADLYK